jgi:hypothetical protein
LPLSDIWTVNVTTSAPGASAPGFGKAMILGAYGKTWPERTREYADITAVGQDFLTTDPEYLEAQRLFSQTPRPPKVTIGRGTLPPTQRWAITPTAANNAVYSVRVGDKTASFTSDGSATVAEITSGLGLAILALMPAWATSHAYAIADRAVNGGLLYECITAGTSAGSGGPSGTTANITDGTAHWKYVGAAVTVSDQSTFARVTVTNPGAWIALQVADVNLLSIAQDHANPGLSTDLDAIRLQNDTWYELLYPWNSSACVLANAAWVEAAGKTYAAQVQDTAVAATVVAGATDVAAALKTAGYLRTHAWYHPATDAFLDAGICGVCLPFNPGTETWKFKRPAGVPVVQLTSTQKANLDAKNCNYYYDAGGVSITGEGKVASGEWIDVVRGRDAVAASLQVALVNAVSDTSIGKLPFTAEGLQVLEGAVLTVLRGFENPKGAALFQTGSSVVVTPKIENVSADDRKNRVVNGITWSAKFQSAIHSGTLSGTVGY